MDLEEREYEKQLQAWKCRRAEVAVPPDFANKVMASVRGASILQRWIWLQRLGAALARSRLLQTAVYLVAVAVFVLRLAAFFAIFVPAS
jgi:hypothetical protein